MTQTSNGTSNPVSIHYLNENLKALKGQIHLLKMGIETFKDRIEEMIALRVGPNGDKHAKLLIQDFEDEGLETEFDYEQKIDSESVISDASTHVSDMIVQDSYCHFMFGNEKIKKEEEQRRLNQLDVGKEVEKDLAIVSLLNDDVMFLRLQLIQFQQEINDKLDIALGLKKLQHEIMFGMNGRWNNPNQDYDNGMADDGEPDQDIFSDVASEELAQYLRDKLSYSECSNEEDADAECNCKGDSV